MLFTLLGTEIEISDGRRNYMHILNAFKRIADEADEDFRKAYSKSFEYTFFTSSYLKKWDDMYFGKDTREGERRFIFPQIKKVRKYLGEFGIYSLTDEQIYDAAFESNGSVSYLLSEILEIILNIRKDDVTDDVAKERICSLMNGNRLNHALRNDIMSLCDFTLEKLRSEKVLELEPFYQQECEEATAIFENLKELEIPVEKQKELAAKLIQLDSRPREYYVYIFKMFDCAKCEIFRIAQYLQIDLSEYVEEDIEKQFDLSVIQSESDAQNMYRELQELMENYGINTCKRQEELNQILNYYDIQARTYQNILFESRDLKERAEQEDTQLRELCGQIADLDKQKCIELLQKISDNHYLAEISQGYIDQLNERIDAIELDLMMEMCVGMENMSEQECNLLKDRIREIDAKEENKNHVIERIDRRIYSIWDEEDFLNFSQLYCKTNPNDSMMIQNNIKFIAETGRTESKKLFLNAMNQMQNLQIAAEYMYAKESGGLKALFSGNKEDVYVTMTLGGRVLHPELMNYVDALREGKGKKKSIFSKLGGVGQSTKKQKILGDTSTNYSSNTEIKKYCAECGSQIDADAKFCSSCGAKQ